MVQGITDKAWRAEARYPETSGAWNASALFARLGVSAGDPSASSMVIPVDKRWSAALPLALGRAKWGASGALYPKSAIAGLNPR